MPHFVPRAPDARLRARLAAGEQGVSLVEVLVSVGIIGVALTGFASVLGASLVSISREQSHVRGSQLANQLVEEMRSLEFGQVGFYRDDDGFVDSAAVVALGPSRPSDSTAPLPGPETVEHDGTAYTVTRTIAWVDDAADGVGAADANSDTFDFKGMTVQLAWSDRGQAYDYTAASSWAPSTTDVPLHEAACADFRILDGVPPLGAREFEISPSGVLLDPLNVYVKTCGQAATAVLTLGNLLTVPLHAVAGTDDEFELSLIGLVGLPVGEVVATISATAADGSVATWTETIVFFTSSLLGPLDIQVPTVSPGLCVRATGTHSAWRASTVQVQVHGFPAPDEVTVAWSDPAGSVAAGYHALLPLIGEGWRADLPAGTVLDGSSTTLTITARRLLDNATVGESFVVPVTRTDLALTCPA